MQGRCGHGFSGEKLADRSAKQASAQRAHTLLSKFEKKCWMEKVLDREAAPGNYLRGVHVRSSSRRDRNLLDRIDWGNFGMRWNLILLPALQFLKSRFSPKSTPIASTQGLFGGSFRDLLNQQLQPFSLSAQAYTLRTINVNFDDC